MTFFSRLFRNNNNNAPEQRTSKRTSRPIISIEHANELLFGLHNDIADIPGARRIYSILIRQGNNDARFIYSLFFDEEGNYCDKQELYVSLKLLFSLPGTNKFEDFVEAAQPWLNDECCDYIYFTALELLREGSTNGNQDCAVRLAFETLNSTRTHDLRSQAILDLKRLVNSGNINALKVLTEHGEYEWAAPRLISLINQGNTTAMKIMANMKAVQDAPLEALLLLEQASEAGDTEAMCLTGQCYYKSDKMPTDLILAAKWLQKAAQAGDVQGMIEFADFLSKDTEYKDLQLARYWFTQAAKSGENGQWINVAITYAKEDTNCSQSHKYISSLRKAMQGRDKMAFFEAAYLIAEFYINNAATAQEKKEAFELLMKAVRVGHPGALHMYGMMLLSKGEDDRSYYFRAHDLFEKALHSGNPQSATQLAYMYANGRGVDQNYETALHYLFLVKDRDAEAMRLLGSCYANGFGVALNKPFAFECFEKAVKMGSTRALFDLGICYRNGEGTTQNIPMAIRLYEKAVEYKNHEAMTNLGIIYLDGIGVEPDYQRAFELFSQAANFQNPNALFCLGKMYFYGMGIERDYIKAVEIWTSSADLGEPDSMFHLSCCYHEGKGVEPDRNIAMKYLFAAADLKWLPAIDFIRQNNVPRPDNL